MNIKKYIENCKKEIDGIEKEWIDDIILRLPINSTIFEIGTATSRDANYIESKNKTFTVIRSDKELEFVNYIIENGKEAHVFDILNDNFNQNNTYNGFYANMVINHFNLKEIKGIFIKLKNNLVNDGFISLSFSLGDNETLETWNKTPGNVFCRYHTPEEIQNIANNLNMHTVCLLKKDEKVCYLTFQA
jgi:hypothetical protein